MENKNIVSILLLSSFAALLFYISGWVAVLEFFLFLALYAAIFYGAWSLINFFRKTTRTDIWEFLEKFFFRLSLSLAITLSLVVTFVFYHTIFYPATLPLYTLSNWEKTVHFQTMSHIASQAFYLQVQSNIYQAKKNNWVLFFEWVRPGSSENEDKFNQALWIDFAPWLYDNLSELYWVVAQDNDMFLWLVNNKDYNIDVSIDDIIEIYEEKNKNQTQNSSLLQNKNVVDINWDVIKVLSELNPRELQLIRYFNQSFLNFILKNEGFRNKMLELAWNPDIFSVIVEDRNKVLANAILESEESNIFVIYWLMHFSGVLKILQSNDPNWKIIETKNYNVISDPWM